MVQLSHLARPGEPRWRSESTLLALRARTACYNKLAGSWRLGAARSTRQCPPPDGTRSAPALSGWGASRLDGTGSAPALRGFARVSLDALVVAACGYHCLLCCQLQSFRLLHVLVFRRLPESPALRRECDTVAAVRLGNQLWQSWLPSSGKAAQS